MKPTRHLLPPSLSPPSPMTAALLFSLPHRHCSTVEHLPFARRAPYSGPSIRLRHGHHTGFPIRRLGLQARMTETEALPADLILSCSASSSCPSSSSCLRRQSADSRTANRTCLHFLPRSSSCSVGKKEQGDGKKNKMNTKGWICFAEFFKEPKK